MAAHSESVPQSGDRAMSLSRAEAAKLWKVAEEDLVYSRFAYAIVRQVRRFKGRTYVTKETHYFEQYTPRDLPRVFK